MGKRKTSAGEAAAGASVNTYGIAVTVMLCFFVMLYAYSSPDADKLHALAAGLGQAPNSVASTATGTEPGDTSAYTGDTTTEANLPDTTAAESEPSTAELDRMARQIRLFLVEADLGGVVEADYTAFALAIRLPDSMFFAEGEADLKDDAYTTLNTVMDILAQYSDVIGKVRVECHTDSVPLDDSLFRDNWELSGIRAARAVKYMLQTGRIRSDSIYYSGYGELRPVADGTTEEGRQANRRLEFVLEGIDIEVFSALEESQAEH